MKKQLLVAVLLALPLPTLAGVEEYSVNGEPRLYESACYWNAPEKIAPHRDGGYNVIIPTMRDDCRVTGTFAKVNIYKYDFVTGGTILFRGSEWLPVAKAEHRKAKLDAAYKNLLNAGFATQVVKLETKEF